LGPHLVDGNVVVFVKRLLFQVTALNFVVSK
jgi:hypothetical protein